MDFRLQLKSIIITYGNDLIKFLEIVIGTPFDESGWMVKRSHERNDKIKISGVILTGFLDNSVIGLALREKLNVIITISPNSDIEIENNDLSETIYKNDLFVYSIGDQWLYNLKIGNSIIGRIFNCENAAFWNENLSFNNYYISFNNYMNFHWIISRFQKVIKWVHPHVLPNLEDTNISNMLIVDKVINTLELEKPHPSIIVAGEISSELINYCMKFKIILVWINKQSLYNEIIRELLYEFKVQLPRLKMILSLNKPYLPIMD